MTKPAHRPKPRGPAETRQLAELARAAGFGDSPDEALQWHREAQAFLESDDETPLLADVLRWQAVVLRDRGRTSEAEPLFARSLAVATRIRYESGRAHALNQISSLALRRGDLVSATNTLSDALTLAARAGESRLVGMIQQNLGIVADIRGNPAAAIAHYRLALRMLEEANDPQAICWVLNNLGYILVREGGFDEAREAFERGLGIARARGDLMAEGILEGNRAELHLMLGEIDDAYAGIRRALDISEQRNDDIRRAGALKLEGSYQRLSGRPAEAVETLRHALTLSAVGEDALLGAEVLYQFGLALDDTGDRQSARQAWGAALAAFERISARQWIGRVRQRLSTGGTDRYL
ncbi:MAG: tetratricopeptide repeat protein [Gemmatimonadaceae bacterium]